MEFMGIGSLPTCTKCGATTGKPDAKGRCPDCQPEAPLPTEDVAAEQRLIRELKRYYGQVAHDLWGDTTPKRAEFNDVLMDRLEQAVSKESDRAYFWALNEKGQAWLLKQVGP